MFFEPFHERFPEIAVKETRTITVANHPRLPNDEFGLVEAYCSDRNGDCRRVMFNVISRRREENMTVIAYGWESEEFYANWLGTDDPDMVKDLIEHEPSSVERNTRMCELRPLRGWHLQSRKRSAFFRVHPRPVKFT